MNIGNLQSSAGRIQEALDDLLTAWQRTREFWNDEQARDFEKQVLDVISKEVATAFPALNQISQAYQTAARDCGEAGEHAR